jgi:hypothetical protein
VPTPTGLPKVGEIWERRFRLPPDWEEEVIRFVVLERSAGDYWSLRVYAQGQGRRFWVDPAYWHSRGELRYIKDAPPELRRAVGL